VSLSSALLSPVFAQDLAPRAYLITPVHSNAVTLTWSFYSGEPNFEGAAPIKGANGIYSAFVSSYSHSLNFFGRSANFLVALPYGVGNLTGDVPVKERSVYRSGLIDFNARFSVNLIGGPAMSTQQYLKWKQKKILGASLKVIAPTGQYDPTKLINWGINRWAFKPEIGYSQRFSERWVVDGYAGVWFYTSNPRFFSVPLPGPQTRAPVVSLECHLSRDLPRLQGLRGWASLDGNFWYGGMATLQGIPNPSTRQTSSRLGATISLPYSKHQGLKLSYSNVIFNQFGGDYRQFQVAWQYSWIGKHW
jgi:hypothetical protein